MMIDKFFFCEDYEKATEDDYKRISNRKLRELRDFLRQRGVWVQKERISITKASVNTLLKEHLRNDRKKKKKSASSQVISQTLDQPYYQPSISQSTSQSTSPQRVPRSALQPVSQSAIPPAGQSTPQPGPRSAF